MSQNNHKDEYDWIESVVALAEKLGMSPVRVRWKLRGWQDKVKASGKKYESKKEAVIRKHKACPKCSSINSLEDNVCHKCGAKLLSRPVEITDRFLRHFNLGFSSESFIALSFFMVYAVVVLKGQGSNLLSISSHDLMQMGGSTLVSITGGQISFLSLAEALESRGYMLWTSVFLHAGIMHLFFNTYALMYISPVANSVYNSSKLLFVFFITGITASALSLAWTYSKAQQYGVPPMTVGIGASGAICGYIGLMLVWGHRDGTFSGISIRNQMGRWIFYILIFGYFIGADNLAHGAGIVAGGIMAFFIKPDFDRPETRPWRFIGAFVWLAMVAAVVTIIYLAFNAAPINPQRPF